MSYQLCYCWQRKRGRILKMSSAILERDSQIAEQERQSRETLGYCPAGLVVVDEDGRPRG